MIPSPTRVMRFLVGMFACLIIACRALEAAESVADDPPPRLALGRGSQPVVIAGRDVLGLIGPETAGLATGIRSGYTAELRIPVGDAMRLLMRTAFYPAGQRLDSLPRCVAIDSKARPTLSARRRSRQRWPA